MTPEERARLRAALIKRISEAEAALEDGAQAKTIRRVPTPAARNADPEPGAPTPAKRWDS